MKNQAEVYPIRVLVADASSAWRALVEAILRTGQPCIINEASDGLEAVYKSRELQPDLILLDVVLPQLGGFRAARQIGAIAPGAKIVFLSESLSIGVMGEALHAGGFGCVQKSDAVVDLLPAMEAAAKGETYISTSLSTFLQGQPS